MSTRFRPSLTKEQLHDIAQRRRNPAPGDVSALLWEIARLRAVVMRASQYLDSPNSFIAGVLRDELNQCECVREQQKRRLDVIRDE